MFDAFKINSDSGQVSVGFPSYKYFIGGYFELTIKGEDYLNTNMYSTYKLKVGSSSIAIGMLYTCINNYLVDISLQKSFEV